MADKILLLSKSVPPETSGSAIIVQNLAKEFSRETMVLAGEWAYRKPAIIWKEEWPQIVYVIKGWPETRRGARWWRRLQFPLLLLRCLRLVRRFQCTAVVVVFPKEEFLLAGYLTAVLSGAKLYPYFHNTYVEQCKGLGLYFARWLQGRVFSKAQHVFVMSEGMVELYRERYPDLRCSALPHSFHEEIPELTPMPEIRSPVRFLICGNINRSCYDATVRLCDAISQVNDASLTLLTGTPGIHLKQMDILRDGFCCKTVSRDEVISCLKEADIVLLPHGFSGASSPEEYRTIFPTRTIEYLICNRPILAHVAPDCYLARFLREHECALVVDKPSIPALLEAFERLRADSELCKKLVRNALHTATIFRGPHVAAMLRAQLQENRYGLHP